MEAFLEYIDFMVDREKDLCFSPHKWIVTVVNQLQYVISAKVCVCDLGRVQCLLSTAAYAVHLFIAVPCWNILGLHISISFFIVSVLSLCHSLPLPSRLSDGWFLLVSLVLLKVSSCRSEFFLPEGGFRLTAAQWARQEVQQAQPEHPLSFTNDVHLVALSVAVHLGESLLKA